MKQCFLFFLLEMGNRANKTAAHWVTAPTSHNGFNNAGPVPWQTIQSATTLQSRNALNSYDSTNNVYNKLLYGIRPGPLNSLNNNNSSSTPYYFQSQNYHSPIADNENVFKRTIRPLAATSRENSLNRLNR